MDSSILDDGEFWLPPEFLTEEDFLIEKEIKLLKGIENGDAFGFGKDAGSKFSFPYESRSVFGSHALNPSFGSPVESMFGSSETESDEENFIAGLTHQMARSTLEDDISGGFDGHRNFLTKAWSQAGSPQSTLCTAGISCSCRQRTLQNEQSRVPCSAAWDLYCAAAAEMAMMKINDDPYGFNLGGRGLIGPSRKPSPVHIPAKNPNIGSGNYNHHSLHYQKLQAIQFQQLKQQQMMKHWQAMQIRSRINGSNNGRRSVGLSPSAWPSPQHAQQPRNGSGMRAVFLANPTGKRESTGTGVFLPRRVTPTSPASNESRKKQTLSTVLVPARVAHAVNLNRDVQAAQPTAQLQPRFEYQAGLSDASLRLRSSHVGFSGPKRGGLMADQTNEVRLPSDWSY